MENIHKYKKIAIAALLCICLVGTVAGYSWFKNKEVVMWLDDYAVVDEEYAFYEEEYRAVSASYFFNKYGIDLSGDMTEWKQDFGGEIPENVLRDRVEQALLEDYTYRVMGSLYGISGFGTFEDIKREYETFLKIRTEAADNGNILYGPDQFGFKEYYFYRRTELKSWLMDKYCEALLKQVSGKLKEYYDSLHWYEIVPDFQAVLIKELMEGEEEGKREEILFDTSKVSLEDMDSAKIARQILNSKPGDRWEFTDSLGVHYRMELKNLEKPQIPEFEDNRIWAAQMYAETVFPEEFKYRQERVKICRNRLR